MLNLLFFRESLYCYLFNWFIRNLFIQVYLIANKKYWSKLMQNAEAIALYRLTSQFQFSQMIIKLHFSYGYHLVFFIFKIAVKCAFQIFGIKKIQKIRRICLSHSMCWILSDKLFFVSYHLPFQEIHLVICFFHNGTLADEIYLNMVQS